MIQVHTELGDISIGNNIITAIAGDAASNCFGVKGLAARSMTDGLVHLLRKEARHRGIRVHFGEDSTISIDLHIVVDNGVNIPAISNAIISEVRYVVQKTTGATVGAVNIFVDSIIAD